MTCGTVGLHADSALAHLALGGLDVSFLLALFGRCCGVGLVFVHYYGGSCGDPEGWFSALGFAAPFLGLGTLALVGTLQQRPALVLAAGYVLMPMALVSFVLIPLLIPAIVLTVRSSAQQFRMGDLVLPGLLALCLLAVFGVLVLHQDPVTWSTPDGGGSSGNIVTTTEATTAIATSVTVVIACDADDPYTRSRWLTPLSPSP